MSMFLTEKQLVEKLKSSFSQICDWDTTKTKTELLEEVNVGYGVADLVVSKIFDINFEHFILGQTDISIYNLLTNNAQLSFENIKAITGVNDQILRKSLKKLISIDYVNELDGKYSLKKEYKNIVENNVAIEAKLKNWKRALYQAFRYKWFASMSFVVLDSNNIKPAIRKLNEFQKYNVGLAEINLEGKIKMHYKPIKEKPYSAHMTLLFNEQVKEKLLSSKK